MNTPPTSQPAASGQEFPCQNCGAKLTYDAGTQGMKCPFCGTQQAVPQQQGGAAGPPATREIPLEEGIAMAARGFGTPVTQVSCNDCGASVNVTPGEQTARCAFCGSQQVLAQEAPGTAIRPGSLVPFKVDKPVANKKFEAWLGTLWFRPNDLKRMAKLQEMGGVYIPFWTFDAWARSDWTADAGYYYYETEHYTDQNGNRATRQVQRTRWQPASGWRQDHFDDTLVCASKGLPRELVVKFQTFDCKQLTPYRPEFLAALGPEPLEVTLEEFSKRLKRRSPVKAVLLNQAVVRGVGNIYADEALFRAGVNPKRVAASLRADRVERVFHAMQEVLAEAIDRRGSSVSNYVDAEGRQGSFQTQHRVYQRTGEPCVNCGAPIKRIVLAQRGTHYCPKCQK